MVSVIIPVYNGEKYIKGMLGDVLRQDVETETIIVDDGSTDYTLDTVRGFQIATGAKLTVVAAPHLGVGAARNRGLLEAHGDYAVFVDCDDRMPPWALKSFVDGAHGADIVFGNYQYQDANAMSRPSQWLADDVFVGKRRVQCMHFSPCPPVRAYRRDFLLRTGLSYPAYRIGEDAVFHYKAVAMADKVATVGNVVYTYCRRDSSACRTYDGRVLEIVRAFDDIAAFYRENGYTDFLDELCYDRLFWYAGWARRLPLFRHRAVREAIMDRFAATYRQPGNDHGMLAEFESILRHRRLYTSDAVSCAYRAARQARGFVQKFWK